MKLKFNLSVKTFFMILFLFVVLFGASGFYYLIMHKQRLQDNLVAKSRLILKINKNFMVQNIVNYNDIALLSQLETIEAVEDVSYSVIVDNTGKVLGHSDVYEIGKTYDDDITKWGIKLKEFSYKQFVRNNENLIVCGAPLEAAEQGIVGYLIIGLSKTNLNKMVAMEERNILTFAGVFSLIFFVLFFIYFHIEISHPIKLVKEGIGLMISNLTQFKFNFKRHDEIGDIYSNINQLVTTIQKNVSGLKDIKQEVSEEEKQRLKNIVSMLYKNSLFVIADEENRILETNIPVELTGQPLKDAHIVDAFKDTDLIQIVTEAYSCKGKLIEDTIKIYENEYRIKAFLLLGKGLLQNRTILIFEK